MVFFFLSNLISSNEKVQTNKQSNRLFFIVFHYEKIVFIMLFICHYEKVFHYIAFHYEKV